MITLRGWWLMVIALILLGVSISTSTDALAVLCLTVLTWFFWSLLVFAFRIRFFSKSIYILRQLYDEKGPVQSLWAQRTYRVRVQLRNDGLLPTPHLRITDRPPYGTERITGQLYDDGPVSEDTPLEIEYYLQCRASGQVRFEGLQVQCADLQGLFYYSFFLREVRTYRVLPAFADIRGHIPTVKRHNLLPRLGTHRYKRPGSGSELLELRDYIPGDPPKTIAWKVSARRDKLITKEFESEVPIRCTFFVDTSDSVRVGNTGENALARLVEMTAALSQAIAGERDLPGLCLFNEREVTKYLRPARSAQHVIQILNTLADVATLSPASRDIDAETLLPVAYGFADEVYPELLNQEINHFPLWLPFWAPRRRFSFTWKSSWIQIALLPIILIFFLPALVLLMLFNLVRPAFFAKERQDYRRRKKVAALLSARHGMSPMGLAELLEDHQLLSLHMQRFLAEHHVPYALPFYNADGKYLFAAPDKVQVLSKTLLQAIHRGKDNELFVLVVDLLEVDDLDPLLKAVKVGISRHHQIILLCPWPPDIPPPSAAADDSTPRIRINLSELTSKSDLRGFLEQQTVKRLQDAYIRIRRGFGRIGVTVLCTAQDDSIKLILDRLKYLRYQGRGVR